MSASWDGNLLNTMADVLVDSTLLVLTVCAYIPQIGRLRKPTSTRGLSPYYTLFNVLFSNAQLSQLLLWTAYAWPNDVRPVLKRIGDSSLKGLKAFGAILGLGQILFQWSCSITVLVSFATGAEVRRLEISVVAFLHAAAVLFPAVAFALPKPPGHSFPRDILMALISMSNEVVAPCSVVLQFLAQLREMSNQHGVPGGLSLLSIGLQVPAMAALGYRWFLRIGSPTWDTSHPAPMWLWYQWGFPAINYMAHALGCALLLASYLFAGRGTAEYSLSGKRSPLLG